MEKNSSKIEIYLDELATDYRTLLLKCLLENSNSVDELQVVDLLKLDTEIKKPLINGYRKNQRKKRAYLTGGLIYLCLGLFLMLINQAITINNMDILSLISISILFAGAIISILAFIPAPSNGKVRVNSKNYKETFVSENQYLDYIIVTKWRQIEGIADDIQKLENVETGRKTPINILKEYGYISEIEEENLREFLNLRNQVVHAKDITFNVDNKKRMIKLASKIIDNIHKKMA